jgi:acetoin:2,6-dichlorophenolindophenol oxidoreductase subunit beta
MVEAIASGDGARPSVFYMGEDVGAYGGIFGSTTDLLDQFGPERVIDTPISETAFIGPASARPPRACAPSSR